MENLKFTIKAKTLANDYHTFLEYYSNLHSYYKSKNDILSKINISLYLILYGNKIYHKYSLKHGTHNQ